MDPQEPQDADAPQDDSPDEDLTGLTDAELGKRLERIKRDFAKTNEKPRSAATLATMSKLVEQKKALVAEQERRAEVDRQLEQEMADLRAQMEEPTPDDGDQDGEDDQDGEGEGEPEQKPEPAGQPAGDKPVPVAASARQVPGIRQIAPQTGQDIPSNTSLTVTAAGDVPPFGAGQELTMRQVGEGFVGKVDAFWGTKARGRFPIAKFKLAYPDDRQLTASASPNENGRKVLDILGNEDALTAAGGICAPVDAYYELAVIATADRPVRDALVRFGADRGGIRFIRPPTLTQLSAGITIWTEANDTTPGAFGPATKPCVTISCGDEITVLVDAIPLCIQDGNFNRMFFPESFDAWYALGLSQHARVADSRLLTRIATLSTRVTDGQNMGAARDILESLRRGAAAYRQRHRMSPNAILELIFPEYGRDLIAADLVREPSGAPSDRLAAGRAEVDAFLEAAGFRVHYHLDSETGVDGFSMIPAQVAGPLRAWPLSIVSYYFHPGAFLHLDGGELDFGLEIRDPGLNATNDVQSFMETFENVAFIGVESIKLVNTVCPSGEASAPIDFVCTTGS